MAVVSKSSENGFGTSWRPWCTIKHPSRPRYVRFVVNAEVDPRFVPLLMRDLTEQAEVLADSFEDALNDPERTYGLLARRRTPTAWASVFSWWKSRP